MYRIHKVGCIDLLVRGGTSAHKASSPVMSVRGRKPMLPVMGTPVTIPSLAKINLNQNVPRDTRTQPRTQQSVGGRVVESDSEDDELPIFRNAVVPDSEDDEPPIFRSTYAPKTDSEGVSQPPDEGPENMDEDDGNSSQNSDGTVCNETFNDPDKDCAMDQEDEPIEQRGKRKAEKLEGMAEGAKKLRGLKLAKQRLEEVMNEYQKLVMRMEDEEIRTDEDEELLADLGEQLTLAQKQVDDLDTPFARFQRELQTMLTNALQDYDKNRRGYGQLKAVVEKRLRAQLKLKSNTDPALVEKLEEALKKALNDENDRLGVWNKAPEPKQAAEGPDEVKQKGPDPDEMKQILRERLAEELADYPEGVHGMGVVIKAITRRVQAEFALEFKPRNLYKDEDGKRYEDAIKQVEKLKQQELDAKSKLAADVKRRASEAQKQLEEKEMRAQTSEQSKAKSIVNQAKKTLEVAQEKLQKLEQTIDELNKNLEEATANYEEAYLSPDEKEQAQQERDAQPCHDDEEAIYKLRWVVRNAMEEFNTMVKAFQGEDGDGQTRNPKEDCITRLYGKAGEDVQPIPKWMKEIQLILKHAKDAIDTAEKNDPTGWEVEGEGEGKENLYNEYAADFEDPDGETRDETAGLAEVANAVISNDTMMVAMTVVVKNKKLSDDEKMKLITLDAFEKSPNRKELPDSIDETFVAKMEKRKNDILNYIQAQLKQAPELPQVEDVNWESMKVYLQAIQMKKDHPNATLGSANYGTNELRAVTIESVAFVNYTVEFEMKKSDYETVSQFSSQWEEKALAMLEYLNNESGTYISEDGQLIITDIRGDHPFTKQQKLEMEARKKANNESAGAKAAKDTTQL